MTPIGRGVVPHGQRPAAQAPHRPAPCPAVDKWTLSKAAVDARAQLGVSSRDLAVLAALLSFHPGTELEPGSQLTVFPSNASLSTRLHGMPESTLRRHLAALVTAGLIRRQDSPNGKRYARRNRLGQIERAFGLDLSPLLSRAAEIIAAAEHARDEMHRMRQLREEIGLILRDCLHLSQAQPSNAALSEVVAAGHRMLRRKLSLEQLQRMHREMQDLLDDLSPRKPCETAVSSASDSQNERHHQSSDQDESESEPAERLRQHHGVKPVLTLERVLQATPDLCAYSREPVRSWHDLRAVTAFVAPMLGIAATGWSEAKARLGDDAASVAVACILQQSSRIRSPGAYLRVLARKAGTAALNIEAMVESLIRGGARLTAVNSVAT